MINLQTPRRKNMKKQRKQENERWIIRTRRLIETVIGQLSDGFHIEKTKARDLWHFTNRITRKVLAHTVGVAIIALDQQFLTYYQ
ncbi:transposase [Piscirickettsia salmonis]